MSRSHLECTDVIITNQIQHIHTMLARLSRTTRFGVRFQSQAFPKGDVNAAKAFKEHNEAVFHHAGKTAALWKKISIFVAFPVIAATAVKIYLVESAHAEHREHMKHIPDEEWPSNYPYQNIRRVPFFWGDGNKTLFWNSDINRNVPAE